MESFDFDQDKFLDPQDESDHHPDCQVSPCQCAELKDLDRQEEAERRTRLEREVWFRK